MLSIDHLSKGKKVFFVSDFHLGVPTREKSLEREKKIVRWMDSIKTEASAIFILGDIFDFWFEYGYTVPKGYTRFLGKLAEITDGGIPVYFFTGNHDMWMFDYFPKELNIPVFRKPLEVNILNHTFLIGHGDGLGPGDHAYKMIKKVFSNKVCQWLFSITPPAIGMGIAQAWSRKSRIQNDKDSIFLGEGEHLWQYCIEVEKTRHHDYYIFGHRHLPLDLKVGANSRYINLGEWVNHFNYASFDGQHFEVKVFQG